MSELGTAEERAAKERRGPASAHRGGPPHAAIGVPTDRVVVDTADSFGFLLCKGRC